MRASRLVDDIVLEQEGREYDPTEVLIDSDDSDATLDKEKSPIQPSAETSTAIIHQTIENPDAIDKICTPCVGSKSTRVVRRNKSMTPTTTKLEEVHVDLWGPHNPLS